MSKKITCVNTDILRKAEGILDNQKRLAKYLDKCKAANICPVCGEDLKLVSGEEINETSKYTTWLICTKDHSHVKEEQDFDDFDEA